MIALHRQPEIVDEPHRQAESGGNGYQQSREFHRYAPALEYTLFAVELISFCGGPAMSPITNPALPITPDSASRTLATSIAFAGCGSIPGQCGWRNKFDEARS